MRNAARNASAMKTGNMLELISIIRRGPVSRADLARETGLTRAAVTIIVDRLQGEGVVAERGAGSGRGRKPILLEIREGSLCFMGVDITRADCSVGIVDAAGRMLEHASFGLSPDGAFSDVLPRITGLMRGIVGKFPGSCRLLGAGVSVPGPVDSHTGIVLNPPNFRMLHGQNVVEALGGAVECGIWADNNASARALWERNLGAGRRFANFIAITVDTGVGSGLVLGGRLYRGMGFAGEAGHVSVDMNGEPCACGNRGCLELYASVPALLRRQCAGRPDLKRWEDIADGAERGDALCIEAVGQEARYLSQSVVNTANLLDLEAVILTGFVAYKPAMLLESMRKAVRSARITAGAHDLEILASGPVEHAGAASAAMLAMERFFAGETGWGAPA